MTSKIENLSVKLKKYINWIKPLFHESFFSVVFTTIIYLSAVLFGVLGLFIYTTDNDIDIIQKKEFLLAEQNSRIIYLDEVLTMSARLAAFTSDMKWKERYEDFAPQLDSTIKKVMELAPKDSTQNIINQIDSANLKLVAMEERSFNLTTQGNRDSALSILFCKEYDKQKWIYANGIHQVVRNSEEYVQSTLNVLNQKFIFAYISIMIFIPILLFSWFVGHRYHKILLNTKNLLLYSEKKYRTLFESASNAIMLFGEKGFFDCNNATLRMFDLSSKEEFIGAHPADLSPPQQTNGENSLAAANQKILEAIKNGKNQFEWVHRRKNGEEFSAEVLLTAFALDNRHVLQATVRDISEQKLLEEERTMRSNLEAINNLVVTINHEMNQPLSVICSYSKYLMNALEKEGEAYNDAKIINDQAWRLANLIKKISRLKRIKIADYSLKTKMIDLEDSADE